MKDGALDCFKIYKAEVENQLERRIKCVRSYRGGEYLSNDFGEYCAEHGIIHETTAPHSPQSNGVAERKNRTLMDLVNAMLDCSGLSKSWWGVSILTACFVLNQVPTSKGEISPYEGWKGRKSALGFLRAWGCLAKVNVPTCKKQKLGPKTIDCIFLGYEQHSAAYKFLVIKSEIPDVHANTMTKSRDATFFENIFPMKDSAASSSQPTYISALEPSNNSEPTTDIEQVTKKDIDAPRRSKRQSIEKSFGDDFIIYLVDDLPKTLLDAYASLDAQ
jgi:hypothetical protein